MIVVVPMESVIAIKIVNAFVLEEDVEDRLDNRV